MVLLHGFMAIVGVYAPPIEGEVLLLGVASFIWVLGPR